MPRIIEFRMQLQIIVTLCLAAYATGTVNNCEPNSTFNPCGTACPTTCNNPTPQGCIAVCSPDCFCNEGYILERRGGRCIQRDACDVALQCAKDSKIYSDCADPCPLTCRFREPRFCRAACRPGCVCPSGYFLEEISGNCVLLDQCPAED